MSNTPDFKRSACAIANTLDILGDKWTLLVVRDLFLGKSTYSEFQKSPENIPTNILADRLKRLEATELISKHSYQQNPVRYNYQLTEKGAALAPVLKAMVIWGNRFFPGTIGLEKVEKLIEQQKKQAKSKN